MLLLLVAAMTAFAASHKTTNRHTLLSEPPAIAFGDFIRTDASPARSAADTEDIDIRVRLDYNPDNYFSMQVLCINENGGRVIDEVDLESDGYMHLKGMPGIYDFVAILTHANFDGYTFVIKEHCDIKEGSSVVLDTYSATNHIQFRPVTPEGNPMIGDLLKYGDLDLIEKGTTSGGGAISHLFNEDHGFVVGFSSHLDRILKDDNTVMYGPEGADIYVNDLGEDTKYALIQITDGFTENGQTLAVLEADGMKSQTVTNTKDSYVYTSHVFSDHKFGNQIVASRPDYKETATVAFLSTWKGDICRVGLQHYGYQELKPGLDRLYISTSLPSSRKHPYEMLCWFGSFDTIDGFNSIYAGRGFGVLSGLMRVTDDKTIEFLDNPAINGLDLDDWTHTQEYTRSNTVAFNNYLNFTADSGSSHEWGNSAPICLASVGYVRNSDTQLRFSFIGRKGETRTIDKWNTTFKMTADGEIITERMYMLDSDFQSWRLRGGEFNSTKAEYKISIENTNVLVDGLDGYNKTSIYYDTNMSSPNPPALRSLQFRNTEGKITDRFISLDEGVVEFYAGDFEYAETDQYYRWFFNYCNLENVKVEYAPYGSGQWRILDVEEVPEMLAPVAYGAFYRGSLGAITAESDNGWYDLRIKLTDASDNYQIQELSPAFKLEDPSGIGSVKTDAVGLEGLEVEIFNLAGIRVWSGLFESASATGLGHGVYVARAKGNDKSQICKLSI